MYNFSDFGSQHDEDVTHDAPVADVRTLGRRLALQALYEIDMAAHPAGDVLSWLLQAQKPVEAASQFAHMLLNGVLSEKSRIDEAIRFFAPEFPLEQVAVIDRNILRIAIYEFAVGRHTPITVAIDEAVKLAKVFGAESSPSFVNGVLGALGKSRRWRKQLRHGALPGDSTGRKLIDGTSDASAT